MTTGLRRSELLALKCSAVDFSTLELNAVRSIYLRMVGNCKTETSRKNAAAKQNPEGRSRRWVL